MSCSLDNALKNVHDSLIKYIIKNPGHPLANNTLEGISRIQESLESDNRLPDDKIALALINTKLIPESSVEFLFKVATGEAFLTGQFAGQVKGEGRNQHPPKTSKEASENNKLSVFGGSGLNKDGLLNFIENQGIEIEGSSDMSKKDLANAIVDTYGNQNKLQKDLASYIDSITNNDNTNTQPTSEPTNSTTNVNDDNPFTGSQFDLDEMEEFNKSLGNFVEITDKSTVESIQKDMIDKIIYIEDNTERLKKSVLEFEKELKNNRERDEQAGKIQEGIIFNVNEAVKGKKFGAKPNGGTNTNTETETETETEREIVNLRGKDLRETNLRDMDLRGADLSYADLSGVDLSGLDLSGANLNNANLKNANLYKADLSRADLSETDLTEADLGSSILDNANMNNSNLTKTNLSDASLIKSNLVGSELTKTILVGANFNKAELTDVDFIGLDMKGIYLNRVDLSGSDMSNSDMHGANLTESDLFGANLEDSVLSNADLTNANLSGANLNGTNLDGANLDGADLTDTILDTNTDTDTNEEPGVKDFKEGEAVSLYTKVDVEVNGESKHITLNFKPQVYADPSGPSFPFNWKDGDDVKINIIGQHIGDGKGGDDDFDYLIVELEDSDGNKVTHQGTDTPFESKGTPFHITIDPKEKAPYLTGVHAKNNYDSVIQNEITYPGSLDGVIGTFKGTYSAKFDRTRPKDESTEGKQESKTNDNGKKKGTEGANSEAKYSQTDSGSSRKTQEPEVEKQEPTLDELKQSYIDEGFSEEDISELTSLDRAIKNIKTRIESAKQELKSLFNTANTKEKRIPIKEDIDREFDVLKDFKNLKRDIVKSKDTSPKAMEYFRDANNLQAELAKLKKEEADMKKNKECKG